MDVKCNTDFKCPVSCGQCCDNYWQDVFRHSRNNECRHITETGCNLDRDLMPNACKIYLCDCGQAALKEEITVEFGLLIAENCLNDLPEKWKELHAVSEGIK